MLKRQFSSKKFKDLDVDKDDEKELLDSMENEGINSHYAPVRDYGDRSFDSEEDKRNRAAKRIFKVLQKKKD